MLNYILYRIGQAIALVLPIKLAYKIAVFVSDLRLFFASGDQKAVKDNLKTIFPDKSEKEINRMMFSLFRNFAKYLVDFFRFSRLDREYIKRNIYLENTDYLDEAIKRGKGGIILSAHLGNWELGGVVTALLEYPFWAVVLPHKHKKVDDFFNYQRQIKGVNVIPLGKAARQCLKVLKENKILAVVADRDFTAKGQVLDLFGKPTFFPEGAAVFALKTGALIVPGFMTRNENDTFTLRFEKPMDFSPKNGDYTEEDIKAVITEYKKVIEEYIRKYPEQWYMFRKFWVENKT